MRNALTDFRPQSTSSSVYDDPWDDDLQSGFESPVSSVHDLGLESADGLAPLTDLDGGVSCAPSGMPAGLTAPPSLVDFAPLPSSALSPGVGGSYPHSPLLSDMGPGGVVTTATGRPELRLGTPVSTASPRDFPPPSPFVKLPSRYAEYSTRPNRQALVDHFCRVLSHLLVFTDHPVNPLRQYILPMGIRSAPVMNAIYALSAAHMEHRGLRNEERSLDFHSQALQGLAQLIADQHASRDEAMAVIILLISYEVKTTSHYQFCLGEGSAEEQLC